MGCVFPLARPIFLASTGSNFPCRFTAQGSARAPVRFMGHSTLLVECPCGLRTRDVNCGDHLSELSSTCNIVIANDPLHMKNPLRRTTGIALATVALAATTSAQSPVDIGLHRDGGMLEVHVRPTSDFNGIFSAVVFTIKWDRSSGATLGTLQQEAPAMQYIPLTRSGNAHEVGTDNYQVFAGFGTMPMQNASVSWTAGEEYVIAKIPVTGKGEFELVNDAWTGEARNNADYYVSLGGVNRTGIIYKSLASADEDGITILPNPNNGRFNFSFTNESPMDITIELVNTLGQTVMTDVITEFTGTYRRDVDLTTQSSGVYYLKIKRNENVSVHKVIFR